MKKIFTKKLWFLALMAISLTVSQAQPLLVQNFNYTGNITSNGWTAVTTGAGTNPIATTTGLTYTGLLGSGVGNAALINNLGGEDDNITFTNQNTVGQNIYFSCMINVTDVAATKTGDYFLHIGSGGGTTFTAFAARVFAKITATGVNFGISNTSTATYGTTNFLKNTTYLLVVKYTIAASGNTPVSLWVIPSGVPATEALAGTPELTNTLTAGQASISAIAFRQGSATASPQVVVDGLLVGLTWADVTPSVATGPTLSANAPISNLNTVLGTASASKSFKLSGASLTGAPGTITLTTSSNDFEVSNDNISWDFSATVPYGSATLADTTIYVRISVDAAAVGPITGTLALAGGGATGSVNLSGIVTVAGPVTQASNIAISNIVDNGFDVNWANGDGAGRILVVRQTATAAIAPADGVIYTTPTSTGSGNAVWYSGAGTGPVTVTGLSAGTNYTVQVYEYNGTAGNNKYNVATATNNPAATSTTGISSSIQQGYFTAEAAPLYAGKSTFKLPYVYIATVSGLAPSTTYRYYGQAAATTDFGTTNTVAGTLILNDYTNGTPSFYTASTGSLSTVGSYGKFTTDATGKFTGTFGFFASSNARFDSANLVFPTITMGLDTGVSAIKYRFALNQSITMLSFATSGVNTGSLIKGTSSALPNNVVALWKSEDGSSLVAARPLSMTLVENSGATVLGLNALYDSTDGSWNAIIPNDLANGVRLIQQFNVNGTIVGCNADADGTWGSTVTVNPSTGITSMLQINAADAPLSTGSCFGILPIKLNSFAVQKSGNTSRLTWSTSQEINSKEFAIERSTNNATWTTIATIPAAGNSTTKLSYNFTDITPAKGINFYRLKLVDVNNKFSNSDIRSVLFSNADVVLITPNPASSFVNIYMSKNNNSLTQIIVTDANGKLVQKINTAEQTYQLKTSAYAKGLYVIKVIGTDNTSTQKIIIQ
jgi:hypothetical protein